MELRDQFYICLTKIDAINLAQFCTLLDPVFIHTRIYIEMRIYARQKFDLKDNYFLAR